MTKKRKALTKTTRFEVFKRDKFACQYCGQAAPTVVLAVDHIHPVAKGGTNDLLNLITSCVACNTGKGARELSDDSAVQKQRAQRDILAERREQTEMIVQWHRELQTTADYELDAITSQWEKVAAPFRLTPAGRAELAKWRLKFSLAALLEAVNIAVAQYLRFEENDKPTLDSVTLAWSKVPGIARLRQLPEPERELYYIRGILRNRLHYCNEALAMELLRDAMDVGIDSDTLRQLAREERNWSGWTAAMHEAIDAQRDRQ